MTLTVDTIEAAPGLTLDMREKPQAGKTQDPPKPEIIPASEGIDDLKKQIERSREESTRRLGAFQRQIDEAAARTTAAEERATKAEVAQVTTTVDLLGRESENAKRDYADALQAGDYGKAAEAQQRMIDAAARKVEAEKGKLALEEQAKTPPTPRGREVQLQTPQGVEDIARAMEAAGNYNSATWVRANPAYATDPDFKQRAIEAHDYAVRNRHVVDSPEYIAAINARMGLDAPAPTRQRVTVENDDARTHAPVSAPVTRRAPPSNGSGIPTSMPSSITLSLEQQSYARELGMTNEAYARQLYEGVKAGQISPDKLKWS